MINHARTLLLNVQGDGYGGHLGDEYLPPEFRPLTLSSSLQFVRRILFGTSPDRIMLNYRAQQLLALLHATELRDYLTALDSRITYDVASSAFFDPAVFAVTYKSLGDTTTALHTIGTVGAPDVIGRCYHQWRVHVTSATTVRVIRQTPPLADLIYDYTITEGLSSLIPLADSGLQLRFEEGVGAEWRLEAYARPEVSLGTLEASLRVIGEPNVLTLFHVGDQAGATEPFKTFYNLWQGHHELPYALGGLVLGLVYSCERIRQGVV